MRKGWEIKKLGEVYDVRDGTHDSPKYHESGHPLVTSKNLKFGKIIWEDISYISDYDFSNINKRSKVDIGDVLFAMIGTIGNPVVVVEEPNFAIKNVALFKVRPGQNSWFLKYYLDSWEAIDRMNKEAKGTTQRFVGLGYLRNFEIPVPPLPEQQRIVSILDEAFEAIDQAKANTERNLQNARELFQSELNRIFTNKGGDLSLSKGEGWVVKKLKEITLKIGSGATPRGGQESYKTDGISLIRSLNVHDDGFRTKDLAFIDNIQADKLSNVEIHKGDVLLNITGASVARCTIVPDNILPARVNQHVSIIRPKNEILHSRFLHLALISKTNKDILLGIGEQGSTRQAITKFQIENFILSFPKSIDEQQSVVNQLDTLSEETKQLEANYQKKLESLEELKKSILQKAFSGELTRETNEIQMEQLDMVAEDQAMYNPNQ